MWIQLSQINFSDFNRRASSKPKGCQIAILGNENVWVLPLLIVLYPLKPYWTFSFDGYIHFTSQKSVKVKRWRIFALKLDQSNLNKVIKVFHIKWFFHTSILGQKLQIQWCGFYAILKLWNIFFTNHKIFYLRWTQWQ